MNLQPDILCYGTVKGGRKAAATNLAKYGKDFYRKMGQKGGRNGHTGGFAINPALARIAGAKGGRAAGRPHSADVLRTGDYDEALKKSMVEVIRDGASFVESLFADIPAVKFPSKITEPWDLITIFVLDRMSDDSEAANDRVRGMVVYLTYLQRESQHDSTIKAATEVKSIVRRVVAELPQKDGVYFPSGKIINSMLRDYESKLH